MKIVLDIDPDHPDALHQIGLIAHQTGKNDLASNLINMAIKVLPDYPIYHNSLGLVLKDQGKLAEAVACYEKAIGLKHDMIEAHNNLGVAFHYQRKLDKSIDCYRKALNIKPHTPEVHNNMGNALKDMGKFEEAIACYEKTVKIKPDYAEAWFNMGNTCHDMNEPNNAASCFQKALEIKPDYAEAYFNMGNVYHELDRISEAINCYRKVLQLKPEYTDAYDNMGKAYQDMGKLEAALSCYENTLRIEPENADAHFDRSLVLLLNGNFKKGWQEYEWRFLRSEWKRTYPYHFNKPHWDGSSFSGKRLFIHSEQGLGDTIHFIRYLPMVKSLGGAVIFEAKKPLLNLFQDFPGIDELLEWSSVKKADTKFDFYLPLLSIPYIFGTTKQTIQAKVPYIYADPGAIEYWRDYMKEPGFKVGLVWAGSPTNNDDRNRSCELKNFFPLSQIPEVQLYGLQKGADAAQVNGLPENMTVTNLGEKFKDFSDTAGVIENLDLVISVDTATAHLAGAMGKPIWTLLPFAPDWRWMLNRETTPWYPTMRLFRQPNRGNWEAVFQQVELELRKLIQTKAEQFPNLREAV